MEINLSSFINLIHNFAAQASGKATKLLAVNQIALFFTVEFSDDTRPLKLGIALYNLQGTSGAVLAWCLEWLGYQN